MRNDSWGEIMGKYDDIIGLPRPELPERERMPVKKRAAQFAPFAALSGYAEIIAENERYTDSRPVPDEDRIARINSVLGYTMDNLEQQLVSTVVYFVPDRHKTGGRLCTVKGTIRRIDLYKRLLAMNEGEEIPIDDVYDITTEGYTDYD